MSKIKIRHVTGIECDHLKNRFEIEGETDQGPATIQLSLMDLERVLKEMRDAGELQRQSFSRDKFSATPYQPADPARLLVYCVKLRLAGDQPFVELTLNQGRPNEARFAMTLDEAGKLGEVLTREAGKILHKKKLNRLRVGPQRVPEQRREKQ